MKNYLNNYIVDIRNALLHAIVTDDENNTLELNESLELWVNKSKNIRDGSGLFFYIGNGASATMAEHMSHDCFQNADMLTMTCSETSHITAISNDLSYEDVFSYRIGKLMASKDMLIAISSSGNSPNIIKAIKNAKQIGSFIVTITGKSPDNQVRTLGNLNFYIPLNTYGLVESAHAVLLHCWLDLFLDKYMGGRH